MTPVLLTRWALLAVCMGIASGSLLPIFFMHGINDNHHEFDSMQNWVKAIDPNVTLYSLPVCDDTASFANLWDQGREIMDRMREQIAASPDIYTDGYTLIAHSQGALTARTVVERMDDHDIHTLISLAGPQVGEFGVPEVPADQPLLKELAAIGKDLVYTLALTGLTASTFQKNLSVANYWNDPRLKANLFGKPHADYLSGNTFLPVLNNDPNRRSQGPKLAKNDTEAARYKRNFLRLKHAVFTAGTADEMIIPWTSGVWEFFDEDANQTVPLKESKLWTEDWVGLRALGESGRLTLAVEEGATHNMWAHDSGLFARYIAPNLPSTASFHPQDVLV
eukprot:TRINITY_DN8858_c0_g1_i1.p1 TRINITY_DN8858_c0_g1~~TRINITY_DN8858_c0_g1_i1.p1  ORF type:complete len:336 (-),score=30.83 TRINITY_DN8858_c0_g1_i1:66-1073(-)